MAGLFFPRLSQAVDVMLVNDFLENSAGRLPQKVALVCGDRRLTYAEVAGQANRLANAMLAEGVARGDRVAIYMDNSVEAVVAIFAALKANAVFTVINPTTKVDKLGYILTNAGATLLVCDRPHLHTALAGAKEAPDLRCIVCAPDCPASTPPPIGGQAPELRGAAKVMGASTPAPFGGQAPELRGTVEVVGATIPPPIGGQAPELRDWVEGEQCGRTLQGARDRSAGDRAGSACATDSQSVPRIVGLNEITQNASTICPPRQRIDVDLATIVYTSGSTGFPKGVMATHLNVVTAAFSITEYLENTEDDVILSVLPLSFDYGLYQLLMAFKVGATLILEKAFVFPYRVIDLVLKENVTGFPGVPTIFAILLQLKDLRKYDFKSLRYITNTAAALPVAHIQRLREAFPRTEIYSMYGLTECKRVSYLPPTELDRRPDSVGKAIPNTEVYVVGEDGRRLAPGMVGELVVRGAHVTRGYWQDPVETARRFRPGPLPGETVLYSGDLFRMDEQGFLYFVGRKDDIIKSRGEKVSPKEVENTLCMLEDVAEAAVVGVPDPVLGQAIKAVLVLRNGTRPTEREVIAHCARHLEDFMVPEIVEFRNLLPKNGNGKVDRKGLV